MSWQIIDWCVSMEHVQVRGDGEVMTASSMKLWVMGALLKERFGLESMVTI